VFYIRTNRDGVNFSVVTAPASEPAGEELEVWLPQRKDTLLQDIDLFKDFAVSVENRGGEPPSDLQLREEIVGPSFRSPRSILGVPGRHGGVRVANIPV